MVGMKTRKGCTIQNGFKKKKKDDGKNIFSKRIIILLMMEKGRFFLQEKMTTLSSVLCVDGYSVVSRWMCNAVCAEVPS